MYKFTYEDKTYELNQSHCHELIMDEEYIIDGVDVQKIIELIGESDKVQFSKQYYGDPCEVCNTKETPKQKFYEFLGYYFYMFTKDNKFVTSSISKDYEENTFGRLYRSNVVDNSFVVNVIVCKECNKYTIEIEQCDM